jgi:sporulation-control protein
MFKNLFAAIGIGSATVETTVHEPVVTPGEVVRGTTVIKGGSVAQTVEQLNLYVMTELDIEVGDQRIRKNVSLFSVPLKQQLTIAAESRTEIPFAFRLHHEMPLTDLSRSGLPGRDPALSVKATGWQNRVKIWLHTGLDIDNGVDGSDRDELYVRPTGPQLVMLHALERMGMTFVKSDVEHGKKSANRVGTTIGCYQEFEYRPPLWRFANLEELEVTFVPRTRETRVLFELDRKRRRDTMRSLTMPHDSFTQIDWAAEVTRMLRL